MLFFVCSISYGQFDISTINVTMCENTSQNWGFDLTSCVVVDANPTDYTIGYFDVEANAIANINAILDPTYFQIYMTRTFYVRVVNVQTSAIQLASFTIYVIYNPYANPAVLTFCDPTAPPIYNLEDANEQISGQQIVTITYYDNPNNGGNVIPGGNFVPTVFPVQILGAEVYDPVTGCGSPRVSITLNTNNCIPCPPPSLLNVSNITDTSARITWNQSSSVVLSQIYLAPVGSPDPLPTTTPTYTSQSAPFTVTGLLPANCYTFYIRTICGAVPGETNISDWIGPFQFCTFDCENNGLCPDHLDLRAFLDSNSNGLKDSNEVIFTSGGYQYQINDAANTITGYSNTGSFKIFDSNPANFYDLNFSIYQGLEPFFSSTTSYSNINIPIGSGSQILYFPVTQLQPYQDLEVQLIPNGAPPRPGFTYSNLIRYKNNGLETIAAGTLNFVNENLLSITSISQLGTTSTANGFSFDFINLGPNEERQITVVMQVPTIPTVALGQVLTNSVTITPVTGDSFPLNNTDDLSQIIVGSYDPNDKTEKHGRKIAIDEFTTNDYLTYTIQFENTGTTSAEFVRIEDELDAQLDLSSVMMISSSHPHNMRKINNKLIWNFYDINLPPTISDPVLSHGFVQFKVKPVSGFSVGTIIPNTADIYFDYNPAIVTNTFETEFVETLSTNSFTTNTITIYPNPASTVVRISESNDLEKISAISVYDIVGKEVIIHSERESSEVNLDVSPLNNGIYFVEITTKNQLKITKKLVIDK